MKVPSELQWAFVSGVEPRAVNGWAENCCGPVLEDSAESCPKAGLLSVGTDTYLEQ